MKEMKLDRKEFNLLVNDILLDVKPVKLRISIANRLIEFFDKKQERISELEEQLKNAIVPKFKYGQECYIVCDKNIIKCKIYNISNSRIQYECEFIDNPRYSVCRSSDCVYATKEEAQAKLKKCEKLQ